MIASLNDEQMRKDMKQLYEDILADIGNTADRMAMLHDEIVEGLENLQLYIKEKLDDIREKMSDHADLGDELECESESAYDRIHDFIKGVA